MLEHEMPVQQDRLDLSQQRVVAIDVRPARLHHADFGMGKVMNALQQKVGWRDKVGVEDGNEFSLRRFQSFGERARFEALAIIAVQVDDGMSEGGVAFDQETSNLDRLVGRVVEQLNVELVFRIIKAADRIEQPIDHVLLVKDGQLHRNARHICRREVGRRFRSFILFVLVIKIDHPVAVRAIGGQYGQDDEIRNQQCQIEGVDLVETLKSLVEKMVAQDRKSTRLNSSHLGIS